MAFIVKPVRPSVGARFNFRVETLVLVLVSAGINKDCELQGAAIPISRADSLRARGHAGH